MATETRPAKQKGPRMKPINLFRALIRKIIANLSWLRQKPEEPEDKAKAILRKKQRKAITMQERLILLKGPQFRTEDEHNMIASVVKSLNCLKRYPEEVQRKISEVAYFVCYGPGRVVCRQGQDSKNLYLILSGEVGVSQTSHDVVTGDETVYEMEVLGSGDLFGEIPLLYDILRTTTITTKSICEFIYIKKEDYKEILDATLKKEWDKCKAAMAKFPYFDNWNKMAVGETCILSKFRVYNQDEIILSSSSNSSFVFFVLEGTCCMIQDLTMVVTKGLGGRLLYRLKTPKTLLKDDETTETHFVQVCTFSERACFGLGENLNDRRIVAVSKVECLLCPRYWIMQNNKGNLWVRIARFLDQKLPTTQQVFHQFLENRRWLNFGRQLVDGILEKRYVPNNTSIHDVPYSIRIKEEIRLQ